MTALRRPMGQTAGMKMRRIAPAVVSLLAVVSLAIAPAAQAAPVVSLTSQQLTDAGFPQTPNVTGWGGTAQVSKSTAAQWADIVISGTAPQNAAVGQLLTLQRYLPTNTTGTGTFKDLNVTTTVQANRNFTMHVQLGLVGTFGYRVGYSTGGASPEFVAFQFQLTTTGGKAGKATNGSATAVHMTSKQLARAGFTKGVNVVGWGGTATISTSAAKAGTPVTISGKAPDAIKPGTALQLERFVATDKLGSGHFEPLGIQTVVKDDRNFSLTFEVNQRGVYGYTLGAGVGQEWVGMEFQLRTR